MKDGFDRINELLMQRTKTILTIKQADHQSIGRIEFPLDSHKKKRMVEQAEKYFDSLIRQEYEAINIQRIMKGQEPFTK